ncbi:MAG: hypothetical protein DRO23_06740 [Thermoprotei archaeon]|nr:MAG: hypothetical protein DRO23_06740 [Thermoprotei archaeon]
MSDTMKYCGSALCLLVDGEVVQAAALYEGLKLIETYPPSYKPDEYIGVFCLLASISLKPLEEYITLKKGLWYAIIPLMRNKVIVLQLYKYVDPSSVVSYAENLVKSLKELASRSKELLAI